MEWKLISDNWAVVASAPLPFLAAFGSGAAICWVVLQLNFNTRLAHQQDVIKHLLEEKLPATLLHHPQRNRSMLLVFVGLALAFMGLAIAVAGAFRQSPAVSPPVAATAPALQSGPAVDAMGRPLPKEPYQPGPILLRKYTRNEAQTIIDALSSISVAANDTLKLSPPTDILPPMQTAYQRVPWIEALKKMGIDEAIKRFSEFGADSKRISDNIEKAINAVPQIYSNDLYRIVGRSRLGELKDRSDAIVYRLQAVKKLAPDGSMMSEVLAVYLDQPSREMIEVLNDFYRWRSSFVSQRSDAARHEIETFL
jgi:hypothetical protein